MATPSIAWLSKYLLDLKYTCTASDPSLCGCIEIPWKGSTCLAVIRYVRTQLTDSDYNMNMMIMEILWYLNDAAREYERISRDPKYPNNRRDELSQLIADLKYPNDRRAIKEEISQIIANSLIPEARKYFMVPKLQHLRVVDVILKPNETLASFMAFLIEILDCEFPHSNYKPYKHLYTELTFILTVLGDSLFECTEIQEVNNLLNEIETIANEAGSYLYSILFTTFQFNDSRLKQDGNAVLLKLKRLHARINDQMNKTDGIRNHNQLSGGQ